MELLFKLPLLPTRSLTCDPSVFGGKKAAMPEPADNFSLVKDVHDIINIANNVNIVTLPTELTLSTVSTVSTMLTGLTV